MNNPRLVFAHNLRRARERGGLSQRAVMCVSGVSQARISGIEAGKINSGIDTMIRLANAVSQPLWQMFKPGEEGTDA